MQELEKILEEIDDIYVDDIAGWGVECNLKERANLPCDNCYECIKEVCKNIIRKHMNDGWISVEERLPEESLNSVIGWDEYRERCCFVQYYGGKWILGNRESVNIIAWRPLPDPYRTERREGE